MELELSLPMDGGNYSNSKGESIVTRIGCGIHDTNYERCVCIIWSHVTSSCYNRGMMDKQILTSKSVDMATNRYAIAVLKDGKLLNNHSNSYRVMVYVTGPG